MERVHCFARKDNVYALMLDYAALIVKEMLVMQCIQIWLLCATGPILQLAYLNFDRGDEPNQTDPILKPGNASTRRF